MIVKTCRFISLILVFVLLFNFFSQQVVYAMPAVLVGYGLIAFAAALTVYGITISDNSYVRTLYSAFQEWCDDVGWTEYLQSSYHQNKMILMGVPIGVASLGISLNTWIRTQFQKGYNSFNLYDENFVDYGSLQSGQSVTRIINNSSMKLGSKFSMEADGYYMSIDFIYVSGNPYIYHYNLNGKTTGLGNHGDINYHWIVDDKPLKMVVTKSDNEVRMYISAVNSSTGRYDQVLSVRIPIGDKPYENAKPVYLGTVNYYAGEAVDYPMDRNPEDREMNLPPPYLGNPNIEVTDAGIVFNGTPDEFLEQIGSNQDYIDKAFDNILNPSNSISKPIVNESEGTITWPNTGTVDWPVNPPIVNPPVTVPDTAEQGIGETNSILTGISEYVGNIFAAPTKTIDFSPLMSIQLTDRFPFCLPFDLRDLIQRFQADRKAPEFEIVWKVRDVEVKYKMEFSQFEKLAEITRWGVFVTFCVGLLLVSRKLIGGE